MAKNTVVVSLVAENERLNRALDKSAREVKKLERQLEKTKKTGNNFLGGSMPKNLEGIAGKLGIAGAAVAGFGIAAKYATDFIGDSVNTTLDLAKASAKLGRETGMDMTTSSAWISLAKQRGIATEQLSLSFGTLDKRISAANHGSKSAADSFRSLGVSQDMVKRGNFSGVLSRISDAFARMKNGPEKTALALQLFGRRGKDLLPILNRGSSGVAALQREMKALHLTVDAKTVKSAQKMREAQMKLNGAFDGLKNAVGTAVINRLASFAVALTNLITALSKGQKPAGELGKAFVDIQKTIKDVEPTVSFIIDVFTTFWNYNKNLVMLVVNLLQGNWSKAFGNAKGLVTSFGQIIGNVFRVIWTVVSVVFGGVGKLIMSVLKGVFGFIKGVISGIVGVFRTGWNLVGTIVRVAIRLIATIFRTTFGVIKTVVVTVWNGIKTASVTVWNTLKSFFTGAWAKIKDIFHKASKAVSDAAKKGFLGPVPWIIANWNKVWNFIRGVWSKITTSVSTAASKISSAARRVGSGIWNGITGAIRGISGWVGRTLDSIPGVFRNVVNSVIRHANDLIRGVNKVSSKIGISLPTIPLMAQGGIVNRPTLAMIGEAGPEAVIPLSRGRRARGASLYRQVGEQLGFATASNQTFVVNNYGGQLDENQIAARWAWQLRTRTV